MIRTALTVFVFSIGIEPLPADDASSIVDAMIRSHGGMQRWKAAPTIGFEVHEWCEGRTAPDVWIVTVEQGPRRAYIESPATDSRMAWDGHRSWSENWQSPTPPRFLALRHFYLANLPWLTQDPGVEIGPPGRACLGGDPTEYVTIPMTFEPGTGDTPSDTYTLYIHPESHRLYACEYTVTYAGVLPEGILAAPPQLLVYDEYETVNELLVPVRLSIYEIDETKHATYEICDWSFDNTFALSRMILPETAVLDTSNPTHDPSPTLLASPTQP